MSSEAWRSWTNTSNIDVSVGYAGGLSDIIHKNAYILYYIILCILYNYIVCFLYI